ncbi:MAG TPA: class I SAM-dependent methyltransferase [Chthoniobacterales bacterium]|nr:class I SAM-dependent methyltransferase [Chthoniobacterales bacterium]
MTTDLASEFAKLAPWIFQFRIDGHDYGGGISAAGDARIEQFFRFAPNPATILELGALEGAHTFMLAARPGVQRVLALEGREANLRKARFVQELLQVRNAEFAQANLEHARLAEFGAFDVVFCSGLLYHLPEPWKLIEQLPAVAPALFIWTQYAAEEEAKDVGRGLRGKIHGEGGPDEPLSGMSPTAIWLTLASLRSVLQASGYQKIDIIHDDPKHANGPAVTIGARIDE